MLDYDRRVSANLVQFLQSMPTTLLESIGKSFNQSNTEFLILYQNPHTLKKLGFAVELIHKLVTTMEVSHEVEGNVRLQIIANDKKGYF